MQISFRPNYSSSFAPPQLANVSLESYQNIYAYDRETLWIPYGLSLFLTMLAVMADMKVSTFLTLFLLPFLFSEQCSSLPKQRPALWTRVHLSAPGNKNLTTRLDHLLE